MPFKSLKQERWLWKNKPELAIEFAKKKTRVVKYKRRRK